MAIVKTNTVYGTVVGVPDGDSTVFRGIPFAKPPVGKLRFAAPQVPDSWEGERVYDKFQPACLQFVRKKNLDGAVLGHSVRHEVQDFMHPPKLMPPALVTNEDCLYLNVWTPAESADEKLPVLCWIHGGGFSTGYSYNPQYDGALMGKRGVILVTITYRNGPLGFLTHPELTERDPNGSTGNNGMLDQVMALKWVQENISAFGGDPDRVTIHGQSAGGISCRLHLLSPMSRGLFGRIIIQSGGGLNAADPTRTSAELADITQKVMDRLGWTIEDLMTKPAQEVTNEFGDVSQELVGGRELFIYQPCIDGSFLSDSPEKLLFEGKTNPNIDIINGSVTGDSWMFSRKVRHELMDNPEALRAFAYSPQVAMGRYYAEHDRAPIRTYFFERKLPGDERGTPHGSELAYMFGTIDKFNRQWTDYDYRLMNVLNAYWTNFAKTGDPNGEGLPEWPSFTREMPVTMHFRDDDIVAENLVDSAEAERVIRFTIEHPGMLESLEGF